MESVTLHYKLGTMMGMNDSMTPADFSRTFSMSGSRGKWVTALADLFTKPESDNYEGLYIRWLYPGCPLVIMCIFKLILYTISFGKKNNDTIEECYKVYTDIYKYQKTAFNEFYTAQYEVVDYAIFKKL